MWIRLVTAAYFISLSVWVGGMIVLAFLVAPITFRVLESRSQAGNLFGSYLRSFIYVELVCALVCAAASLLRTLGPAAKGGPDAWAWAQMGLLAGMIAISAVHDGFVLPKSRVVREKVGDFDEPARNSEEEAARGRFQRLHRFSEVLFGVNMLLGLCLIAVSVRTFLR